jgi:carotenoid cleavage dioxygenase
MSPLQPTRRDALRWAAHGAAAAPLAAFLAACGGDDREIGDAVTRATGGTTASTTSGPPPPTNEKWWLSGNFGPVTDEVEAHDLEVVDGTIPPELSGLYVRNGSNPATDDSTMWFFGDGMGHGVRLERGKARWYRNRYVQTPLVQAKAGFGETAPGGQANQSNVSFVHHGGRLLSSGEVGFPYEIDPTDLSTVGVHTFDGVLTSSFTAHPKIDPDTGLMHSFGYGFVPPYLTYHVTDASGAMTHTEVVPVERSTMIHDFAITDRDVVFWELPVEFDIVAATEWIRNPDSGLMPYRWRPDTGARVGIMPLGGPASEIRWYPIDPCYVFHGVNAFRDGDRVVLDVCRLTSMFDPDVPGLGGDLSLRRWTVDTATGKVTDDVVRDEDPGELPSRDPRKVGREHRYGYLVQSPTGPDHVPSFGGLIKHDYRHDSREVWRPHGAVHSGEWLFVPIGGDPAEDAGYLMSFLYDDRNATSELAIVDATDVAAGPVARIAVPQRVPYGFHAAWVPA